MSYKITPEIENDIEALEEKFMMVTVNYGNNTFTFRPRGIEFLKELDPAFQHGTLALLRVGLSVGVLTQEQVDAFTALRGEMEQFIAAEYRAAIATGSTDTEAREAAAAAWKNRPVETVEVEQEENRPLDEVKSAAIVDFGIEVTDAQAKEIRAAIATGSATWTPERYISKVRSDVIQRIDADGVKFSAWEIRYTRAEWNKAVRNGEFE